ncbi:MAG TPA: hypothetical protein VFI30_01125 [Nocardioidaceae bacterium]|nr:hypothetical protein [Nocardioidaceae bacterium]
MTEQPALPDHDRGEVFLDARGGGRALRLTWHHDAGLVVFSLWRSGACVGTFRMEKPDVAPFVDALISGLRDSTPAHQQFPAEAVQPAPEPAPAASREVPPASEGAEGLVDWAFHAG